MKAERVKTNSNSLLWTIIIFVLILILITSGVLSTTWLQKYYDAPNVISITPEESEIVNNEFYKVFYRRVPTSTNVTTGDMKAEWDVSSTVDLFKESYMNDKGEITVKSEDGTKVIAPGTTNSYSFFLKNTGNVVVNYALEFAGAFALSNEQIPFVVRLYKDNEFIVGAEDEWCTIDKINDYEETGTLDVGKTLSFTLEWKWDFESDIEDMKILWDVTDTELAAAYVNLSNSFEFTIHSISEEIPGAVAVDEDGNPIYEKAVEIDPNIALIPIGGACGLGFLWLLLFLFLPSICITGFVPEGYAVRFKNKHKKYLIRKDKRFILPNVRAGKNNLELLNEDNQVIATWNWKLNRKKDIKKPEFFVDDKAFTELTIDKHVKAIELHFEIVLNYLIPDGTHYATLNKDCVLCTPSFEKEPDENGCNTTPDGLMIDKKKRLSIVEKDEVEEIEE